MIDYSKTLLAVLLGRKIETPSTSCTYLWLSQTDSGTQIVQVYEFVCLTS